MIRRTKIVATLGPATNTPEKIENLILAGVNVFRLNFSHGEQHHHKENFINIRKISKKLGYPVAILQDLQGPKIRTATFAEGKINLKKGEPFRLTCADNSLGDINRVGVTYNDLYKDVNVGDDLLLDDGRLKLQVTSVNQNEQVIFTEVVLGGILSNNKGINIPNADLSIPALTEKDLSDLEYGVQLGVDWVAVSFVRNREDVLLARAHLEKANSTAKLMAKIEKPSAVERFGEILAEVDGVMVARGDLGVELPPEKVPPIQKQLIKACIQAGKPVITATQMLESMIVSPTPTRAEASDVANAIYDGTDAVMLSGETATGKYPIEAVEMMNRIALTVETNLVYPNSKRKHPDKAIQDVVPLAACDMAHNLHAGLIVTFTGSGDTALRVSSYRPSSSVLAITPSEHAYHQMAVLWGVIPAMSENINNTDEMVTVANQEIKNVFGTQIHKGDYYISIAGVPFGQSGTTNLLRVERVK